MKLSGLTYTSPYTFTRKQRLLLQLLPPLAAGALRLLYATCRIEVRHTAYYTALREQNKPMAIAIWHEAMGSAGIHFRRSNFHTLTSYSYDGEIAARVVHYLGLEAVRGSSSRGGHEALAQLGKAAQKVPCVGFTLDGPRGPRRQAKPGIAILAARSQLPVLPLAFAPSACKRLSSWDRFPIPKPGATILGAFGPPIPPPKEENHDAIEHMRLQIETELNNLQRQLEDELNDAQKVPLK